MRVSKCGLGLKRAAPYALSGHRTGAGVTIKDVDLLGLVEVLDHEALKLVEGVGRDLLVDGAPPDLVGTNTKNDQPMRKHNSHIRRIGCDTIGDATYVVIGRGLVNKVLVFWRAAGKSASVDSHRSGGGHNVTVSNFMLIDGLKVQIPKNLGTLPRSNVSKCLKQTVHPHLRFEGMNASQQGKQQRKNYR